MQDVEPDRMVAATAGAASGGNVAAAPAAVGAAGQRWWAAGSRWAERVERAHGARDGVGDRWRIQPPPPLLSINPSPAPVSEFLLARQLISIFPPFCEEFSSFMNL